MMIIIIIPVLLQETIERIARTATFQPTMNAKSMEIVGDRPDTYITDALAKPRHEPTLPPNPEVSSPANFLRRRT